MASPFLGFASHILLVDARHFESSILMFAFS